MANKILRIVLCRNDDIRTLIKLERKNSFNFYSYPRGQSQHVSYHSDGRTHKNSGPWLPIYTRDYHEYIKLDEEASSITTIKILHSLIIVNNSHHHGEDSYFKKYNKTKKNKNDLVNTIDSQMIEDDQLLLIITGIAKDENQINDFISGFKIANFLNVIILDIDSEGNVPSMFVAAIAGNTNQNESISEINNLLGGKELSIPSANSFVVSEGNSIAKQMITIKGEFGPPPPPRHLTPPDLPFIPRITDTEYNVEMIVNSRGSRYVQAGALSLKLVLHRTMYSQEILIAETANIVESSSISYAELDLMDPLYPPMFFNCSSYLIHTLKFNGVEYRGHREQQIEISGIIYQVEFGSISFSNEQGVGDGMENVFQSLDRGTTIKCNVKIIVLGPVDQCCLKSNSKPITVP